MAYCLKQSSLIADGYTSSGGDYYKVYSTNIYGTAPGSNVVASVVVADTATTDIAKCVAVAISGAEYQALQSASGSAGSGGTGGSTSLLSLSAEDGAYLSAAIVGCWIAAYFVRSIINVVKS